MGGVGDGGVGAPGLSEAPSQFDLLALTCHEAVTELLLTLLFHCRQELVVVLGVVMDESQLLDSRPHRDLDRLLPAAVAPAFLLLELGRRMLRIVKEEIGIFR